LTFAFTESVTLIFRKLNCFWIWLQIDICFYWIRYHLCYCFSLRSS